MKEDAFYDRLREGFNDIFLTLGIDGNAGGHGPVVRAFRARRALWTQKHDLSHIPEKDRQKARYKLADDYRKALLGEPMKLIEHIVRNDRPFTEVVTADYIMVTPYTARGYGIFDEVRGAVQESRRPVRVHPGQAQGARRGGARQTDQESATGDYPHAGMPEHVPVPAPLPDDGDEPEPAAGADVSISISSASTPWSWPPASPTPRRSTAKYPDPDDAGLGMRGLPQDARSGGRAASRTIYDFDGVYGRRKGGWYKDMFAAGFEGEELPARASAGGPCNGSASGPRRTPASRSPWSSTSTTSSRAARSCCRPKDLDDPLHAAKRRAYQEQRRTDRGHRRALRQVRLQPQGRLQGLDRLGLLPRRRPGDRARPTPPAGRSWTTSGLVRMLAPEQLERKIEADLRPALGPAPRRSWRSSTAASTRRRSPSAPPTRAGPWGRSSASCPTTWPAKHTLRDFALEAAERRLFPGIEPDVLPGSSPEADAAIRRAIVHLHELVLGTARGRAIPRRSRARSTSSPASSPTPGPQKGLDSRESLPLPGQRSRRPRRSALHHPRLARRGHLPAATTRIPLRVSRHAAAISSSGAAWPASAWPSRSASRCRPARRRRTTAIEGPYYVVFNASGGWDTTYLMDPKGVDGINRLYQARATS